MILLQLFLSFLQIGLFSFGGGYAALPLIQEQVVNAHHWLNMAEFSDLITISQMTPGPIAINTATFVGTKIAGVSGALVATIGCILPSCILVSLLAYLYIKYKNIFVLQKVLKTLRPAIVALIAGAGLAILMPSIGITSFQDIMQLKLDMLILFFLAIILIKKKDVNPILVMVLCGFIKLGLSLMI